MAAAWWALDFPFMKRGRSAGAQMSDLATTRNRHRSRRHRLNHRLCQCNAATTAADTAVTASSAVVITYLFSCRVLRA